MCMSMCMCMCMCVCVCVWKSKTESERQFERARMRENESESGWVKDWVRESASERLTGKLKKKEGQETQIVIHKKQAKTSKKGKRRGTGLKRATVQVHREPVRGIHDVCISVDPPSLLNEASSLAEWAARPPLGWCQWPSRSPAEQGQRETHTIASLPSFRQKL